MKKLQAALAAAAVLLAVASCAAPTNTTNTVGQNPVKVGDPIVGGFTVTKVDTDSTGYIAERTQKLLVSANNAASTVHDAMIADFRTGNPATKSAVLTYSNGSETTGATLADTKTYYTLFRREAIISGTWTKNLSLTNDIEWTLAGPVFIGGDNSGNATLYIDAGTIIKGTQSSIAPGMLVVTRGSKIYADGSKYYGAATNKSSPASVLSGDDGAVSVEGTYVVPIVFTSSKNVGSRAPGDWGGLVINGNAPVNDGPNQSGSAPHTSTGQDTGEGNTGFYGGSNANDNSGVLKYVRSEFAGVRFTADNELNGIAFQGVGRGTTIDYIQAHMSNDDGVEMFGGTANMKHVVSTGNLDDYLDWTSGWVGAVQYMVGQQYPVSGIDNGMEGDGKENNVTATPYSNPYLANITMVGARSSGPTDGTGQPDKRAGNFRRGTKLTLINSIFTNFASTFLETDSTGSAYIDGSGSGVTYKGVLVTMPTTAASTGTYNGTAYTNIGTDAAQTAFTSGSNGNYNTGDAVAAYATGFGKTNLPSSAVAAISTLGAFSIPVNLASTSITAATAYSFGFQPTSAPSNVTAQTVSASVNGATLDDTDFVGAIDPAGTDWTAGWTTNAYN